MKLTVFTDQEPSASDSAIIAKFENKGYRVGVDSIHKNEFGWIIDNYKDTPHRVYFADKDQLYDGEVFDLHNNAPLSFIACFSEKHQIYEVDWEFIRLFIKSVLYDTKPPRLTRRMSMLLQDEHMEIKQAIQEVENDENIGEEVEQCYSFQKSIFEDRNIAVCEIVKPIIVKSADKKEEKIIFEKSVPYTVVIRNFATRGYYPLFWSLFICNSWGKDNKDIQFLKALWTDLKMEGEFNMDEILDNGMKECNWSSGEGACAGPEVYRKSITETLENLMKKERGYIQ